MSVRSTSYTSPLQLGSLCTLIVAWTIIFGFGKYFGWNIATGYGLSVTLEQIAGYLSLGWLIGYISGMWILPRVSRSLLVTLSLGVALAMIVGFSLISAGTVYFSVCMTVFGIAYAYWVIARTSLTADVAENSGSETRVAAITNLAFIVPIVLASYAGSKLYELYGVAGLAILLIPIALYGWKYRAITPISASERILPRELLGALRASWKYVLAIGLLWAISTAASQLIIQVLAKQFSLPASSATLVLLASSVGVIIGSIVMAKMPKSSIQLTNLGSIVLLIILFITLPFSIRWLESSQFVAPLYGIALAIGIIFACSVSAIEGVFYRRLATLRIQTLGGVLYGIGVSVVNVVLMFSLDLFNGAYGFANGFFLLALGMLVIGVLFGREG